MAIRTKGYVRVTESTKETVRAVQVKETNVSDLVAYIVRNGGAASGRGLRIFEGVTRPARIRIKQRTFGATWAKRDWRVAALGDYIVKYGNGEFARIKQDVFEREFAVV